MLPQNWHVTAVLPSVSTMVCTSVAPRLSSVLIARSWLQVQANRTGVSIIEGTVNDTSTRGRVPGAVVTAVHGEQTEQTISDDHGRFRFDGVAPGTYSVSAYYSVGGRGQIEDRRSEIAVAGSEAVLVPLWIELGR